MIEAATEFRKNSFNDQDSATLAKVASVYQNVADEAISAGDSASFIISQMKAFNIASQDAQHIIDAVNETSNRFAVSSADVATALTKTSSAMGVLGNDFNQTIGLVTAGAEILTGQASKVARGLRTIGNNFANAATEAGSISYQVDGVTKSLSLLDSTTGDMKSTFQIFNDLKGSWDKMTNAEKQALAIAYAGKNQFEVFAAVMDNFKTAINATATAVNSAGSAARENDAYMQSLESRGKQLQAVYQDFANNVLSKDLVAGFMEAGQGLLEFANNDVGQAITRIGLFSGAVTGAIGILGQLIAKFVEVGSTIKKLAKAGEASNFLATLTSGAFAIKVGIVVAALVALFEIGRAIKGGIDKANRSLAEFDKEIASVNDQIATNKQRIAEINALPWQERTTEILNEKAALEKENEELERKIKLLEKDKIKRAKSIVGNAQIGTGEYETRVYYSQGRHEETTEIVAKGVEAYSFLTESLKSYAEQLRTTGKIEDDRRKQFDKVSIAAKEQYEALKLLIDSGEDLNEIYGQRGAVLMRQFMETMESFNGVMESLDQTNQDAEESSNDAANGLNNLAGASEETAAAVQKTVQALVEQVTAVDETTAAYRELVAQEIIFNQNQLSVAEKIKALQALAIANGVAADSVNKLNAAVGGNIVKPAQVKKLAAQMGISEAEMRQRLASERTQEVQTGLTDIWDQLEKMVGESQKTKGTKSTTSSRAKSSKTTKEAKDEVDNTAKELEAIYDYHKKITLEKLEAERKEIELNAKNTQAALDQYQAQIDEIEAAQEVEVAAIKQQLQDQLDIINEQQDNLSKQLEGLQQQEDDIQAVIGYATEYADRQIDALNEERSAIQETIDAINAKYDAQLEGLEKTNSSLDDQIKREQLLKALAEAQSKKKLVFQGGRFVYAQDIAAVRKAQDELDAFDRQKQVEKEKAAIEEARKNELAYSENRQKALDEEIKRWEEYKKGWGNLVSDYQYKQNALIASEKYGINIENQTWNQRLSNASKFADKYADVMAEQTRVQQKKAELQEQAAEMQAAAAREQEAVIARMERQADAVRQLMEVMQDEYDRYQDQLDNINDRIFDTRGESYEDTLSETERMSQSELKDLLDTDWSSKALQAKSIDQLQYYLHMRQLKADKLGVKLGSSPIYPSQDEFWYRVAPSLGDYGAPWGFAKGTTSAPGGLSLVGEKGPELRVLGNGDGILPSNITSNLWSWGKLDPTAIFGKLASGITGGLTFNGASLSFPNVRDGNDAKSFVTNLRNMAYQYAFSR
nr:MAG TPA: minor tail protein [Caudoviricetes sp.]